MEAVKGVAPGKHGRDTGGHGFLDDDLIGISEVWR